MQSNPAGYGNFGGPSTSSAPYEEEQTSPDDHMVDVLKARILAHPLFKQLLEAHVACLRAATPVELHHTINAALSSRDEVAAKYVALLSHLTGTADPSTNVDPDQLTSFMMSYIVLLRSFKEQLCEHLRVQASEAITACWEIEQALFNLTGVSAFSYSSENAVPDGGGFVDNNNGPGGRLGIDAFLPCDIQKLLRDHVRQELKQELKEDYRSKLKEVRDEIIRKRRAGKLPGDTTHVLKDWWFSHANWPYPTEEEKSQLMQETGLEIKQINNWFINQRKRNWQQEGDNPQYSN